MSNKIASTTYDYDFMARNIAIRPDDLAVLAERKAWTARRGFAAGKGTRRIEAGSGGTAMEARLRGTVSPM